MFLSTPPSRVATMQAYFADEEKVFLSTPPSRVATGELQRFGESVGVSIHATLAGGDVMTLLERVINNPFLSTPPSRVATLCGLQ